MKGIDQNGKRRTVLNSIKQSLANMPPKTIAGQMRELYQLIEERITAGVRKPDLVIELNRLGIQVSLSTFETTLKRLRRQSKNVKRNKGHSAALVLAPSFTEALSNQSDFSQCVRAPNEVEQIEEFSVFNKPIQKKRR